MPELAVIVVTWNAENVLPACLASIEPAAPGLTCEVVVVDNASSDQTCALVETLGRELALDVRLLRNSDNQGLGRANQRGFRESSGPFVAFLNPDVTLEPSALSLLVERLRTSSRAGVAGPAILDPDGSMQHGPIAGAGLASLAGPDRDLERFRGRAEPSFTVHGCCMVGTRAAFEAIGGFPTDTFLYGEELLVGTRMARRGYEVWFDGRAEARHRVGHSVNERWSWEDRNLVRRRGIVAAIRASYPAPYFWVWNALKTLRTAPGMLAGNSARRRLSRRLVGLHLRSFWPLSSRPPAARG